jgi:hypothetical protein
VSIFFFFPVRVLWLFFLINLIHVSFEIDVCLASLFLSFFLFLQVERVANDYSPPFFSVCCERWAFVVRCLSVNK